MTPPRTLVLVRHGKSSWKTNEPDRRRPLSARGTRDAVVAGQQLAPLGIDRVLVSPATRAQQTWQCLQMGGTSCADVRTVEALYDAGAQGVLDVLRALPGDARTVVLVGHEPTLGDLVTRLCGPGGDVGAVAEKFPTSAVAVLTFPGAWGDLADGSAHLAAFEIPRG